jgi:hypothetical protein
MHHSRYSVPDVKILRILYRESTCINFGAAQKASAQAHSSKTRAGKTNVKKPVHIGARAAFYIIMINSSQRNMN